MALKLSKKEGPRGYSKRAVIHGAGELHGVGRVGEFPGVMRYQDAQTLGAYNKQNLEAKPFMSTKRRMEHDKAVREYLGGKGFSAEGDFLVKRQGKYFVGRKKSKQRRALEIAGTLAALGLGGYGAVRFKRWLMRPPNMAKINAGVPKTKKGRQAWVNEIIRVQGQPSVSRNVARYGKKKKVRSTKKKR